MEEGCGVYIECPDLIKKEVEEPCVFDGQELIYVTTSEMHYAMTLDAAENMAAGLNYLCGKKPSDYTVQEPPKEEPPKEIPLKYLRGVLYVTFGVCYVGALALLVKWLISLM